MRTMSHSYSLSLSCIVPIFVNARECSVNTLSEHERIVERISEAYAKRGLVVQTRGNNLPYDSKRGEAIYKPDLLVRDTTDKQIPENLL